MNIKEAIDYIEELSWKGSIYGLERMRVLLEKLGNPEKKFKAVHVAGTNGKGSTSAMIASVLKEAGYRTGLYTSPHLISYNERLKINGIDITDEDFCRMAKEVKSAADTMKDSFVPTVFERITAMAFLYFADQKCDFAVIEVGLGGRLDATNVILPPVASVICRLDLEHTELLGNTITEIAKEKGGIIKKGSPVILYGQSDEAQNVIKKICEEKGCRLVITDKSKAAVISKDDDGQVFNYRERKNIRHGLIGSYQLNNAMTALDTIDVLKEKYDISEKAVFSGLKNVKWQGRFQLLMRNPYILVDGAHNPNGTGELARCLADYFPNVKFTFVCGVMADKDYDGMLSCMVPFANRFITVTPKNDRALDSASLKDEIERKFGIPSTDAESVEEGLKEAVKLRDTGENICIFGSLYQVGDVLKFFDKDKNK